MVALYAAFGVGQPSPLPQLPLQYADFAVWQRRGHTVAVLAPAHFEEATAGAGLDFHPIDSREAYLADVGSAAFWGPRGTALGLAPGGYLHPSTRPAFDWVRARLDARPWLVCTRNVYGLRFAAE